MDQVTSVGINTYKIEINGISVSYCDTGGSNQVLIFIHGFPFNKSMWNLQASHFSSDFRVITYDIRGFGQSSPGRQALSMELFAEDLIVLMNNLKLDQVYACGLSMGGYVLMNAVGRNPDRFKGIILADTQCIADSIENKEKRYKAVRKIESEGLSAYADEFAVTVLSKKTLTDKTDVKQIISDMILQCSARTINETLHALAQRNETCSLIKKLSLPALILCGNDDTVTPESQAELIFSAIIGAKMHMIKDAGHLSNIEQPLVFNMYLERFLKEIIESSNVSY